MNVLVLAAHPDDETLGCGASIYKYKTVHNADIRVITFTDGGSARSEINDRRSNLLSAGKMLGFSVMDRFNFPDNEMDKVSLLTINREVENCLKKNQFIPNLIFTHNPWCLNMDHRVVFECTQVVGRPYKCKIMCYEVPSSSEWNLISNFRPNSYIEVSKDQVEMKIKTLKECYADEMRESPHPRSIENVFNLMKVNGSTVGVEYAERFMTIKEVL